MRAAIEATMQSLHPVGRASRPAHTPNSSKFSSDPRRQFRRFLVQPLQVDVDRAQRLLEVEVLVHLLRRDADIAAGRQAPVMRLRSSARSTQLHQPLDIAQLRIREALLQPVGLLARSSAAAAAPRRPPPAPPPAPCAPVLTSALSHSVRHPARPAPSRRCRSPGPRASPQGRSAWSGRGSAPPAGAAPPAPRAARHCRAPPCPSALACAAASVPNASMSAVSVACALVSSSHGSASGSFSRFTLGEGLDQVDQLAERLLERRQRRRAPPRPSATACAR